ncbi:MAG: hypothetical protein E7335_00380 [Clostridiales bacterium]|nr:hypothetical protein [Clostridiales bacterium]
MNAILLTVSVIMNLLYSVLRNSFCKKSQPNNSDMQVFNAVSSLISAITLAMIALVSNTLTMPSTYTLLLGIVFGIVTGVSSIMNLKALECGPLSYTSIICSCSMIIPALSGFVMYGDPVSASQWIGIALMLVSFVCAVDSRGDRNSGVGVSFKWFFLALGTFFCSGSVGIMQKIHQGSQYKDELSIFLVIAFLVATLTSILLTFYYSKTKNEKVTVLSGDNMKRFAIYTLVTGFGFALCNQINMFLAGAMPSIVFFPIVNGAGMLLTSAAGIFIWKERFTNRQWFGMVTGAVAIFLLCNLF